MTLRPDLDETTQCACASCDSILSLDPAVLATAKATITTCATRPTDLLEHLFDK
jgi:hypothetical protein